jgi:hypothetical protein
MHDDVVIPSYDGKAIEKKDIDCHSVSIESSGSGDIVCSGVCKRLKVSASGSSRIDLSRLKANDVIISSSGSASILVHCRKEIMIFSSGSGRIVIYGKGVVTNNSISGSAIVERREKKKAKGDAID